MSLSTGPVISPRAGLLATMNIQDETHEIALAACPPPHNSATNRLGVLLNGASVDP